jgi:hypothetical protein
LWLFWLIDFDSIVAWWMLFTTGGMDILLLEIHDISRNYISYTTCPYISRLLLVAAMVFSCFCACTIYAGSRPSRNLRNFDTLRWKLIGCLVYSTREMGRKRKRETSRYGVELSILKRGSTELPSKILDWCLYPFRQHERKIPRDKWNPQ